MRASSLLSEALAVLGKEWTSELRSRVALNAIGLFALTTLIAVAYQIGPYRISEADRPFLLAALLWIILFFAASSGLARVFVKRRTPTPPRRCGWRRGRPRCSPASCCST